VNLGAKKKPEPKPQHLVKPPVEPVKKPEPVHKLLPEKPKPEPVKTRQSNSLSLRKSRKNHPKR
jgi:colicin import membrane protein